MKSGFGFLFFTEIHLEDGFLEGEIRFRISRLITKSKIPISKSNRDLLIKTKETKTGMR